MRKGKERKKMGIEMGIERVCMFVRERQQHSSFNLDRLYKQHKVQDKT